MDGMAVLMYVCTSGDSVERVLFKKFTMDSGSGMDVGTSHPNLWIGCKRTFVLSALVTTTSVLIFRYSFTAASMLPLAGCGSHSGTVASKIVVLQMG